MGGIMFGAALKGIGDGVSSLGGSAMNYEREEQRRREQELLLRERLDSSERNVDARIAAQVAKAGGGGAKGIIDFKEGSEGELMMAQRMGITVPELRRINSASKTGDYSDYATDVPVPNGDNVMDPRDSMAAEKKTERRVPDVAVKYAKDKARELSEIKQMFAQGDAYDDAMKGRKTGQEMGIMSDLLDGRRDPKTVAKATAAAAGKLPYDNLGEAGVFDQYDGGQQLNGLGNAKIGELNAKAAREAAGAKDDSLQSIQQLRKSAEESLKDARKALTEFDKINQGDLSRPGKEKLKAQRDALVDDITGARKSLEAVSSRLEDRLAKKDGKKSDESPPAAAAPAPVKNPAPSAAPVVTKTQADYDALPSGALYIKDGKTYRKK